MVHIVLQMCLYERLRRRRRIRALSVYFSNLYVASRDNVPNTLGPMQARRPVRTTRSLTTLTYRQARGRGVRDGRSSRLGVV